MKTHNIEEILKKFDEKYPHQASIMLEKNNIKKFIYEEIKSLLEELRMEKRAMRAVEKVSTTKREDHFMNTRNLGWNEAVQEQNQKINSLIK